MKTGTTRETVSLVSYFPRLLPQIMSLRDTLRKAASLIVELPPEPTAMNLRSSDLDLDDLPDTDLPLEARLSGSASSGDTAASQTVAQLVRRADGPNLDQIEITEEPANAIGEKALDFVAIYAAAKLPETQFGADEMLGVLRSIPGEVPLQTKRVTVKAVLGGMAGMGASPENIMADASRKLAALEAFHGFMERKTGETIESSQSAIADLEAQIEARRQAIQNARGELARVTQGCESEADKLDEVLEFFSLDEGASSHAAPANGANL